jgi:RNA polymerase sigma-70 factor (ECF subfamily)
MHDEPTVVTGTAAMTSPEPEVLHELVTRSLTGDQSAYESIYAQCAPLIYRLCYGLLMNRQDAEDVMQEAFVYAFRNLSRFDPARASFKTWLYTIALSRCRNQYRRKHLPWIDLASLLPVDLPAPRAEAPEASLARRDLSASVQAALTDLSPALREAVVLRYGHGLTYREIAEVTGCPQKTAESRVRLAHDRLRGLLQQEAPGLLDDLLRMEA